MKIKICPQCGTKYEKIEDQFKTTCNLRHCPKCGHKYIEMSDEDFQRSIVIFGLGIILLPLIFWGITLLLGIFVPHWPAWILIIVGIILLYFWIWLMSLRVCKNCHGYFSAFFTKRNIPLKEIEIKREEWEEI